MGTPAGVALQLGGVRYIERLVAGAGFGEAEVERAAELGLDGAEEFKDGDGTVEATAEIVDFATCGAAVGAGGEHGVGR